MSPILGALVIGPVQFDDERWLLLLPPLPKPRPMETTCPKWEVVVP